MNALFSSLSFLAGFSPPLSIAVASAAIVTFLAAAIGSRAAGNKDIQFRRTPFDAPVLAFMAVWLLASLTGMDPAKSLEKILSQTRFIIFYLLIWTGGGRHRASALKGYLWGAAAATLYGFAQGAAGALNAATRFPALFALDSVNEQYMGLRVGRIHGAVHPLTYAEVILPFFFLGAGFLLEAEGRRKILGGMGWVLAAGTALLLSQSRGPWLGAAAGGAVLILFHPRRLRLLLPLAFIGALVALSPGLRGRAGTLAETRNDVSASDRLVLWNNTWQVIKRHPLMGVGPGCLKEAVEKYRSDPGFLPTPRGKDGDAHNQFLQHLAERGLLGLLALLGVMFTPIRAAWKTLKGPENRDFPSKWVLWGLFAAFLAFPLINLTERVFDDAEPTLVFWILASLLVRTPGGATGDSAPARS